MQALESKFYEIKNILVNCVQVNHRLRCRNMNIETNFDLKVEILKSSEYLIFIFRRSYKCMIFQHISITRAARLRTRLLPPMSADYARGGEGGAWPGRRDPWLAASLSQINL